MIFSIIIFIKEKKKEEEKQKAKITLKNASGKDKT